MRSFAPLWILSCLASTANAEINSALSASSGIILTNISGYKAQSEVIAKNFDFKWLSFRSRILAAVGELQVGYSSKFKVTQLMETRAGIHYYPFAFGTDFNDFHETSNIRYRASLKPYVHAKVGYGRYAISIVDDLGAAEVGSNYISIGAGLGTQYHVGQSFAIDANIDGSFALGTSEVAFSGLLIRPRFGLLLML